MSEMHYASRGGRISKHCRGRGIMLLKQIQKWNVITITTTTTIIIVIIIITIIIVIIIITITIIIVIVDRIPVITWNWWKNLSPLMSHLKWKNGERVQSCNTRFAQEKKYNGGSYSFNRAWETSLNLLRIEIIQLILVTVVSTMLIISWYIV